MAAPSAEQSAAVGVRRRPRPGGPGGTRQGPPVLRHGGTAPVVFVVCGRESVSRHWAVDCSAATENLLLEAVSLGLGAVWVGIYTTPEHEATVRGLRRNPRRSARALPRPARSPGRDSRGHDSLRSGARSLRAIRSVRSEREHGENDTGGGTRRLWRQRRAIVGLGAYVLAALVATEVVFLGAAELALASLDLWLSLVKASDLNLALSVYRRAAPALTFLFLGLTYLGSGWGNVVLATVGVSWLAARRMTLHAAALLYIMLGGWCLSELTKVLIGRARPEVVRLASATGYSFPSGHAVLWSASTAGWRSCSGTAPERAAGGRFCSLARSVFRWPSASAASTSACTIRPTFSAAGWAHRFGSALSR